MSTAKFNQWLNSDGTENYKCRAWVNFNGTGTVAIRASGNVSSITDNGTGDYTVNFTTAMPDANYCAVATGALDNTTGGRSSVASINSYSTGSVKLFTTRSSTAAFEDDLFCNLSIFR